MYMRLAACAAFVVAVAAGSPAQAADTLTLEAAFVRVAERHPGLRLLGSRADLLAAERERAALGPAYSAGIELENVLGTGAAQAADQAELTLTLSSVLERGGKLDARRLLAQRRFDALAVEREARRLDLLAEVARRYLAAVEARALGRITADDIEQRRETVAAAQRRLQAGASPESLVLSAQAALARAELEHARMAQRFETARQHLAALWGERAPTFEFPDIDPANADLAAPAPIPPFPALAELLESTPELQAFAGEKRIREARLQLARSQSGTDLEWRVGLRRMQESDDFALVAGLSLPIGAGRRAQPEIRAAAVELTALDIEREAQALALYSTLLQAHGRHELARVEARRLRGEVLPLLERAQTATARAFEAGAAGYLEWAVAQTEYTTVRRQQLEAALEARRALIEIQRLTGQAFTAGAETGTGDDQ
jgi:cobalt-zinc-cadmium efflux system outer membrane protein